MNITVWFKYDISWIYFIFDTLPIYYEYFGPRQEFPSIIFWPKHNFITITFPLKKLVQRPFKKSQFSCLAATKSKYDSTNRKCWNVWHGWREMSSFRHVLVTTFFVILNLMADTGIGIRVYITVYYPFSISYQFVSSIKNDPYKLLLLGWLWHY